MKQRAIALDGNLLPPELVGVMVLLDRSGSMSSIRGAMEQAWTKFVADQRAISPDGMWVTLHQFDGDGYDEVYDRTPLANVGALGLAPRGSTPLRASLAKFLTTARAIVDDPADATERLLVVVITDGGETEFPAHPTWKEIAEHIQGIEGENCEVIWLGTSAAILEMEDALPQFAQAGSSFTFGHNASGAGWVAEAMSYTAGTYRMGKVGAKASLGVARSANAMGASLDAVDEGWAKRARRTLAKAKTEREQK